MKQPVLIQEILKKRLLEISKSALLYQKQLRNRSKPQKAAFSAKNHQKKVALRENNKPLIINVLWLFNFF